MNPALLPRGQNPKKPFITGTELLSWPGYTGQCVQILFCAENYQHDDYSRLRILFPERLAVAGDRRRAEYLAGRYAADFLLRKLGYYDFVLHSGYDRAPCWPAGICGALAHSGNTALCAIHTCDIVSGIGIDVEYLISVERSALIQHAICHTGELNVLSILQPEQRATLIFSAKESLFKAIYPQLGIYFGFHDAEMVSLERSSSRFVLRLRRQLSTKFWEGKLFEGHYRFESEKVITIIFTHGNENDFFFKGEYNA